MSFCRLQTKLVCPLLAWGSSHNFIFPTVHREVECPKAINLVPWKRFNRLTKVGPFQWKLYLMQCVSGTSRKCYTDHWMMATLLIIYMFHICHLFPIFPPIQISWPYGIRITSRPHTSFVWTHCVRPRSMIPVEVQMVPHCWVLKECCWKCFLSEFPLQGQSKYVKSSWGWWGVGGLRPHTLSPDGAHIPPLPWEQNALNLRCLMVLPCARWLTDTTFHQRERLECSNHVKTTV